MYKALTCALIAAVAPAFANEGWLTNIDQAVEQAAKENKSVLVEFTGSDWCPPCMALKSQVFPSDEFKQIADKDLVLVELDFPKKKSIPAEQKAYNDKMSEQYGIQGFPTVYLLNSKGQPYWVRVGGGKKDEYLDSLKKGIETNKEISDLFAQADKASGMEKAGLLAKALKMMPADLMPYYKQTIEEITKIDTKDTLGYGAEVEKQAKQEAQKKEMQKVNEFFQKEVAPLFQQQKFGEVIAKANEYLDSSKDSLSNEAKQMILLQIVAQAELANKNIDAALATLDKAVAIDPKSEGGQYATSMIDNIKKNRASIEKRMKGEDSKDAQ